MKRVSFSVRYSGELAHPIHRRMMAGHPVSRMELLMWGPMVSVTTLSWFDADREATADVLEAVESVVSTRLVSGDGGTYAFVGQSEYELGGPVLDLVARSQVVFVPPVVFRDTGRVTFEAVGQSDRLGAFYDDLAGTVDADIEAVHDFSRWSSPTDVTDRQRAALEAAVEVGYYDVPRTGTVEDVAAQLDCAASTAGELLRRAESTVLTAFVASE
ncbi:helix-turn-helix domain-containing protein (plasmid) [Halorussus limi]|uniref:Helix-turn-helix domain-containing protein n=1 Tax=Halorussus limi TaxID=2938695 RepID=A0A8U0I0D2_9EURY|nr:helix-turn-helix domain-containing protein [Halorussus limi]UPV76483.1 helix-turn-helix domain-containing protein [Halorussus limi]